MSITTKAQITELKLVVEESGKIATQIHNTSLFTWRMDRDCMGGIDSQGDVYWYNPKWDEGEWLILPYYRQFPAMWLHLN